MAPGQRAQVCVAPPQIEEIQLRPANRLHGRIFCGDEARVTITLSSNGFDGAVGVNFLSAGGDIIESHVEPVRGQRVVEFDWTTKKPDDTWTSSPDVGVEARLYTREAVEVHRLRRDPSLDIVRHADASRTNCIPGGRRTGACIWQQDASGAWTRLSNDNAWAANYDVSIGDGEIHVTGKLKLVPQLGANPTQANFAAWKREIEGYWNGDAGAAGQATNPTGKWKAHRRSCGRRSRCDCAFNCCKLDVVIHCDFVTSGEHRSVRLYPGAAQGTSTIIPGTTNVSSWWTAGKWFMQKNGGASVPASVRAHEFGHAIGLYDWYPTGWLAPGIHPGSSMPRRYIMRSGGDRKRRFFNRWLFSASTLTQERFDSMVP